MRAHRKTFVRDEDYEYDEETKTVNLTERGIEKLKKDSASTTYMTLNIKCCTITSFKRCAHTSCLHAMSTIS